MSILTRSIDAVRLFTRVCALPDDQEHSRRLREIETAPGKRAKTLATRKKSNTISETEYAVLRDFPEQGIELAASASGGRQISTALVFADALYRLPVREHKAIVNLLWARKLLIATGIDPETKYRREFIIRADA